MPALMYSRIELAPMAKTPDDHVLTVEEGRISPVIILATILLGVMFVVAFLYRIGISVL